MSTQARFAQALLPSDPSLPTDLRSWDGSDPSLRFGVHRNTVLSSLASALAEAFPVVRRLVGAEFFQGLALAYVRASPPRSPVLLDYGDDFAGFVAGFAPAAGLPYLADMARLERARAEACHAADAPSLDASALGPWLADPPSLDRLRLSLHPSLRLLRCAGPVLGLWLAHQVEDAPALASALEAMDSGPAQDVAVFRPRLEVRALALPVGGWELLASLATGCALPEAVAHAALRPGFDLQPALDVLLHTGVISAMRDQGRNDPLL